MIRWCLRMASFSAVLFGLLFFSSGCATPIHREAQWFVWSSGARSVPFQLVEPPPGSAHERDLPVLVAFHGRNVDPDSALEEWRVFADKYGFLVLVPVWEKANMGKEKSMDMYYDWIEALKQRYPINSHAIYIAGTSAGGLLAQELIEDNPRYWAGAAILAYAARPLRMEKIDESWPPVLFLIGKQDNQNDWNELNQSVQKLKLQGRQADIFADPWAGHEHAPEWDKKIAEWFASTQRREAI